jgi:hypothetical protein
MQELTRGVVFSKALNVVSEYFKVSLVKASRPVDGLQITTHASCKI